MLKKILIGIAAVIALLSGYIAMQPAEYLVAREVTINAKPEVIFPYINNSKKMMSWNPWTKMDADAKFSFTGPDEGVGAVTAWDGGKQLGTGSATVVESRQNEYVKTKLVYLKPMQMEQHADLTLAPSENGTKVRWAAYGENKFFGRMMCFFMNMDKQIGGVFEQGLGDLKVLVEAAQ